MLQGDDQPDCYVEVKNVQFVRSLGQAEFPDSVTARGTKHLKELTKLSAAGARTVTLYIIQRADCNSFSIARDIDPKYFDEPVKPTKKSKKIQKIINIKFFRFLSIFIFVM